MSDPKSPGGGSDKPIKIDEGTARKSNDIRLGQFKREGVYKPPSDKILDTSEPPSSDKSSE